MGTSHHKANSGDEPLGRQLAHQRRSRGLSQRELAARSGVDQADISRIERGALSPTTTTLDKLARALGSRLRIEPNPPVAPPGSRNEVQRPYAIVQQLEQLRGPTSGTIELDRRLEGGCVAHSDTARACRTATPSQPSRPASRAGRSRRCCERAGGRFGHEPRRQNGSSALFRVGVRT